LLKMAREEIRYNGLSWLNIPQPTEEDTRYLGDKFKFHPLDLKDCLSVTGTPKIDVYEDYLFIVFHFPEYNHDTNRILYHELDIFIGKNYLITMYRGEFESAAGFVNYLKNDQEAGEQYMSKGPGFLLYNLIGPLFKKSYSVVDKIGENITRIEDEIYSDKTMDVVKELAIERRHVLNFRRIIEPQRFILDSLVHLRRDFLGKESEIYFDDIHDHIERIWLFLENYREIVEGLHDTNEAMMSHKINEIMKMLTLISVCLLPLTLIASIYGMNIELPLADHPNAIWVIMGVMFLVIVSVVAYVNKKAA